MKKYIAHNSEETKKIAAQIAANFQGGEVLGLVGTLGAGKTNFVQGLAKYLNIKNTVNSPTFVLMKPYPTGNKKCRLLVHVDCYRLNSSEELLALGIKEYFNDKRCLTVIEWADKIANVMPANTVWIKFKLGKKIDEREIEINN
ncbi:MAG TPA: tRNA (adenosine(37)-N6)-threonylcarbamoyltransferase complex ATPase subunit type 1 TsaE [bacterium]|mgnify:CR=1 FL=1|nr:tRNA (adenosine(37)-N6)-threonylcarbamoyltransferase complex ATPase subunit type 1 TsaE [bacterium]